MKGIYRIRTEYSFGRTFAPIKKIVEELKKSGVGEAAIVDDNTWGHVKWHKACREAGIKPILGVECIVSDKDEDERKMWFLARNVEGLRRLYRSMSKAHQSPIVNRWGRKPRLFREDVVDLAKYGDVLIFSGDITDVDFLKQVGAILDVSPASQVLNRKKGLIMESDDQFMTIWTPDMRYVNSEDKAVFAKLCPKEVRPSPQSLLSVMAEDKSLSHLFEDYDLPKAPMVEVPNAKAVLKRMCNEGLAKRGIRPLKKLTKYIDRMNYELNIISEKGFDSYFVIVADMCQYAKKHMLVGPSRGSAAGSLVCYLTGITEIDPIPAGLMFERFIDITRYDFPDIDLDFPDNKRQMVFDYMQEKYQHVAHIGTVTKFKPALALNTVCRNFGINQKEASAVKDAMVERTAGEDRFDRCLFDTFGTREAGRIFADKYPEAAHVAASIENHVSHTGVHAAGLIISGESVSRYAVIDDKGIAHIDMDDVTDLGLLKIDILGLRTLSILEDTANMVGGVDWYNLKINDRKAFELFNTGRLCGIFQFEGRAVRQVARQMSIQTVEDLQDIVSLARPGPMQAGIVDRYLDRRSGLVEVREIHKKVDTILKNTFGLPIYQENTMALVREVAGFDWKDTGKVRKAVSKKKVAEVKAFEKPFIEGAVKNGVDPDDAEWLWGMLVTMGTYQFNKCLAEGTLVRLSDANGAKIFGGAYARIEDLYNMYVESPSKYVKRNSSMPNLISLFPDNNGRPQKAISIIKNGEKDCIKLVFQDGTEIECTPDHRFIINGEWSECGKASAGDVFVSLESKKQDRVKTGSSAKGKKWNILFGNRSGTSNPAYINGRSSARKAFREFMIGAGCFICGGKSERMEVHHNDFNGGEDRPYDLSWLCSSCHKKEHYKKGRKRQYERGLVTTEKMLVSVLNVGKKMTYDIEMPDCHNFVITGGIVTHNSHARSYASIAYWTAWAKANHPMEFAAATLRNAKDTETAMKFLRELEDEGVPFVPFDPKRSELDWSVQDGKLVGGFLQLYGVGEVKAKKLMETRNIAECSRYKPTFHDIWPMSTRYASVYENADGAVLGKVYKLSEIPEEVPHNTDLVFLARIEEISKRNYNDPDQLAKRAGVKKTGPADFIDMKLVDDSSDIRARITGRSYREISDYAMSLPIGTDVLVRAVFLNGHRFAFINKIKRID